MRDTRVWWLALAGSLGGLGTWLVSEPFVYTAAEHGGRAGSTAFTLGSFYGWFAHYMLGALIAGFLSFVMSLPRSGFARSVMGGLVAACVGGALTCGADALSDWIGMRFIDGVAGALAASLLVTMGWHLMVSMSIALSVAISSHPTPQRMRRAVLAGIGAAVASYFARDLLGTFDAIGVLTQVDLSKVDPKHPEALLQTVEVWKPWSLQRLGSDVMMGLVIGLALGFADSWMRAAWLRRELGRNEGWNYALYNGANRIGSSEGLEVPLRGEEGVAPIHAVVAPHQGQWIVTDVSGQGIGVNGYAVASAYLQEGDAIQIGRAVLRFRHDGPVPEQGAVSPVPIPHSPVAEPGVRAAPADHRLIDPFGQVIPLPLGNVVIGRGAAAQVRLDYDAAVSAQHAVAVVGVDGVTLRVLGGRSLTEVNRQALVADVSLQDGDQIKIGQTVLLYRR